jgi:hypothetical protein
MDAPVHHSLRVVLSKGQGSPFPSEPPAANGSAPRSRIALPDLLGRDFSPKSPLQGLEQDVPVTLKKRFLHFLPNDS